MMYWILTLLVAAIIHLQAILTSGQTDATELAANTVEYKFLQGRDGSPGRDGRDGITGLQGHPGFPGFPGHKGEVGDCGLDGDVRPQAPSCPPGTPGRPGLPGEDGLRGQLGFPGEDGHKGEHGVAGIQGPKGSQGQKGQRGSSGASSTQTGGVSYTLWGKSSCRTGSSLVYAGRTGVPYSDHGGGSNYVCMPNDPEYTLPFRAGVQGKSYMYGVEYRGPPLVSNRDLHNAPCAVCYVSNKNTALMIPAKTSCPNGWMKEYYGYLMSEHRDHRRTEYVCVDRAMDSIPGSQNNINSGHFCHVEAHCDGMACPPYDANKELNCVVCTK